MARTGRGLFVLLAPLLVGDVARAHSWYPHRCCNDIDCSVVTRLERRADGSYLIESGHITVVVPKGFPIEPSQDRDAHVCVYRDVRGQYHPRCVFLPAEV